MFYKTFVLKHYARLTGKHLRCNLFFDKVVNIKSLTSLKQNFVYLWIFKAFKNTRFFLINLVIIWNLLLFYFLEDNSLEFMQRTSQSLYFFIRLIHSLCFITILNKIKLKIKLSTFFSYLYFVEYLEIYYAFSWYPKSYL